MKSFIYNDYFLWIPTLFLSLATLSNYVTDDVYGIFNRLIFINFILFIVTAFMHSPQKKLTFKYRSQILYILGIGVFNAVLAFFLQDPKYFDFLNGNMHMFYILLLVLISVIVLPKTTFDKVLTKLYIIFFVVGAGMLMLYQFNLIEANEYLNSNTRGFMMAPLFIYLLINSRKVKMKFVFYIIGCLALYYSDAETTFFIFLVLPVFLSILNKVKQPRLVYSIYFIIGLLATYIIAQINSDFLTSILATRNNIWEGYIEETLVSVETFLTGTGQWGAGTLEEPRFKGLNAHNTFVGLFHYNGIIVLLLYILFIIFSMRKRLGKVTVSDGILFLVITFQFSESNVPLLTFVLPGLLFLIHSLINKTSEVKEEEGFSE